MEMRFYFTKKTILPPSTLNWINELTIHTLRTLSWAFIRPCLGYWSSIVSCIFNLSELFLADWQLELICSILKMPPFNFPSHSSYCSSILFPVALPLKGFYTYCHPACFSINWRFWRHMPIVNNARQGSKQLTVPLNTHTFGCNRNQNHRAKYLVAADDWTRSTS